MIGSRLDRDDAEALVGREFAGHVYAGAGNGRWLAGKVISYCAEPTICIERDNGERGTYSIAVIRDWAAEDGER